MINWKTNNQVNRPTVIGTGLIALDAVITSGLDKSPRLWAGGTCGNVLAILSYLGWQSFPVARFNGDVASKKIRTDLQQWGVHLDFVDQSPTGNAPIIVQYIRQSARGEAVHSFSWNCPVCTSELPRYRPIHIKAAREVAAKMDRPTVFFLDRLSPGSLLLAQESAEQGAIIFFEPSGLGDQALFERAVGLTHVLKYSRERLGHASELLDKASCLLQIETLGKEGLRYKSRIGSALAPEWVSIPGRTMHGVKDSAGAGDWTSAGIIDALASRGLSALHSASPEWISEAFLYGQTLAAWSCQFEGARGAMYSIDKQSFHSAVDAFRRGELTEVQSDQEPLYNSDGSFQSICPTCSANH